jgi:nitrite reductase/ring-hydroxylating ferredoxin subunit
MSEDAAWHDLGSADGWSVGDLRGALVRGNRLCVGRAPDGWFAIDDECPHAGGSLSEGIVDGGEVICPLHAYAFDPKTGHCPDDPGCSIRAHEVRVEGGRLQVRIAARR